MNEQFAEDYYAAFLAVFGRNGEHMPTSVRALHLAARGLFDEAKASAGWLGRMSGFVS